MVKTINPYGRFLQHNLKVFVEMNVIIKNSRYSLPSKYKFVQPEKLRIFHIDIFIVQYLINLEIKWC